MAQRPGRGLGDKDGLVGGKGGRECEILGYDPLFLACEGRVVAVVAPDQADRALAAWQALPEGREAALLGTLAAGDPLVILDTELGGSRILEQLEDDPLPRIC